MVKSNLKLGPKHVFVNPQHMHELYLLLKRVGSERKRLNRRSDIDHDINDTIQQHEEFLITLGSNMFVRSRTWTKQRSRKSLNSSKPT